MSQSLGNLRSQRVLGRPEWSIQRAVYKSMGYSDHDLERPLVGIANSWNRLVPGHYNLQSVAEYVKQGVFQAGGTPVEFGLIAACDGIAQGHVGMHYILPTRELVANDVEMMVQAHQLDAVVLLGSCDKIVPGLLMAAARLDLPAIVVVGGPMEGGCQFDGRASDLTSITEGLGMLRAGKLTPDEYRRLEDRVAPTCGSCSFLGTANTMCCVAEAMGMCLPGSATIPATHAARLASAQAAGRQIVELVRRGVTARQIINRHGIENAFRLGTAIGGSTNLALHIPAIAYEAECDEITMDVLEELSRTTPHVARMNPAAALNVPDFHAAGGVPAVMSEILPLLHGDALTVTGRSVAENVAGVRAADARIIRALADPWSTQGGLAVLRGNLAPRTAITKPAAIDPRQHVFTGRARCFDSEEAANQAILDGAVQPGEVVVIRYEGPKGGPGINNGCFVGHVSPEAAEGGPLAAVCDGDTITIDIPHRRLDLQVADREIQDRLSRWRRPPLRFTRGYLALYAQLAESADQGAIIRHRKRAEG
jgi:dihydroxy-acid dehydratase